ncbi:hypothetical protein BOX15_Mlig012903g6, partial [Macrostomum lignano]
AMPQQYPCSRKLCVLYRDNPRVRLQPMRDAFDSLQFERRERNVLSGETNREVYEYFDTLADDQSCDVYDCLVVGLSGCYNALDGWGINVSGLDVDFDRLLEPFSKSPVWRCKPKVFIVQYDNEGLLTKSRICCDANRLPNGSQAAAASGLPVFADTALVLGHGGPQFTVTLCDLVTKFGNQLEFHQLMTLVNQRVLQLPRPDDMAPWSVGVVSHLTKKLYLGQV